MPVLGRTTGHAVRFYIASSCAVSDPTDREWGDEPNAQDMSKSR